MARNPQPRVGARTATGPALVSRVSRHRTNGASMHAEIMITGKEAGECSHCWEIAKVLLRENTCLQCKKMKMSMECIKSILSKLTTIHMKSMRMRKVNWVSKIHTIVRMDTRTQVPWFLFHKIWYDITNHNNNQVKWENNQVKNSQVKRPRLKEKGVFPG